MKAQIVNFGENGEQYVRFDNVGDAVDAHDGEIAHFDGLYYLYGTSYDCGYQWGKKDAPFCGFKVYASKDLKNWEDKGFLFDASTAVWQRRCNGNTYGCYRPHVIYNKKTKKYVLWINVYDNSVGYRVFTSKTPAGPFSEVKEPKLAVNNDMPKAGLNNGDHDTFVDDDGTAYIAYTDWRSNGAIVIEKLSDDYLTGSGEHIKSVTGERTEAPGLFKRKGKYYIIYSDPNCGYCTTGTSYRTAPSPLGPWSSPIKISDNSCGGQPSFVSTIKINSETVYLYGSDLWNNGAKNEALANYYWAPLSFADDGKIELLNCSETYKNIKTQYRPLPTHLDAHSGTEQFITKCDVKQRVLTAQKFSIKRTGKLETITVTVFKNNYPNDDLIIDLYKSDKVDFQKKTPVFSAKIPEYDIGWSAKNIAIHPNINVTALGKYILVLRSNTTSGCYGYAFTKSGVKQDGTFQSVDEGKTFEAKKNNTLKFQTFVISDK